MRWRSGVRLTYLGKRIRDLIHMWGLWRCVACPTAVTLHDQEDGRHGRHGRVWH